MFPPSSESTKVDYQQHAQIDTDKSHIARGEKYILDLDQIQLSREFKSS